MVDSHVHLDSLERSVLEARSLTGTTAVVADGSPMLGLAPASQTVFDFYERRTRYRIGGDFSMTFLQQTPCPIFIVTPAFPG